jgi:hypothetical protein
VSCAAARLCRLFSSRRPPRTTCTIPASRSAVSRSSRAVSACGRRDLWNHSRADRWPPGTRLVPFAPRGAGTGGASASRYRPQGTGCARAGSGGRAPTGRGWPS